LTLYVTNLPGDSTPADLAALFGHFGLVSAATVCADPARVCGSVRLDHGGWGTAVAELDGCEYRGRTLGVRAALPWGRFGPGRGHHHPLAEAGGRSRRW
jgi:hypothetical protein